MSVFVIDIIIFCEIHIVIPNNAISSTTSQCKLFLIGTVGTVACCTSFTPKLAVLRADAPSPAAWVRNGYTTSLEQWVIKKDMSLSQNHVFLGDVAAWMTSDLAGIRPDPMAPGFSHVLIEPHFPAGLDKVESSYKSVSGTIAVKWVRRGRHIRLRVKIPGNVTAAISAEGLTAEVGPGIHRFVL